MTYERKLAYERKLTYGRKLGLPEKTDLRKKAYGRRLAYKCKLDYKRNLAYERKLAHKRKLGYKWSWSTEKVDSKITWRNKRKNLASDVEAKKRLLTPVIDSEDGLGLRKPWFSNDGNVMSVLSFNIYLQPLLFYCSHSPWESWKFICWTASTFIALLYRLLYSIFMDRYFHLAILDMTENVSLKKRNFSDCICVIMNELYTGTYGNCFLVCCCESRHCSVCH